MNHIVETFVPFSLRNALQKVRLNTNFAKYIRVTEQSQGVFDLKCY